MMRCCWTGVSSWAACAPWPVVVAVALLLWFKCPVDERTLAPKLSNSLVLVWTLFAWLAILEDCWTITLLEADAEEEEVVVVIVLAKELLLGCSELVETVPVEMWSIMMGERTRAFKRH